MTEAEKKTAELKAKAEAQATSDAAKAAADATPNNKPSEEAMNPEAGLVDGFGADDKAEDDDESKKLVKAKADTEFDKQVNEAYQKQLVDAAVARRMAQSGIDDGAIDIKNPYGLKPGQKVAYMVNGQPVDCDGKAIKKSESHLADA